MEREPAQVRQIGELRAKLRPGASDVAVVPSARPSGSVDHERGPRITPAPRVEEAPLLEAQPPDVSLVRLDLARRLAFVDGARVDLPPKEFDLLAELVARAGRPIGAAELAKRAWPPEERASVEDVHRHIYRLRRALGPRGTDLIANRRGFGYVLEA